MFTYIPSMTFAPYRLSRWKLNALSMPSSRNLPQCHAPHGISEGGWVEVLVVFVGHTQCRYLRWLKAGFKHCFVALRIDENWVVCDSLKNCIELSILKLPTDFNLGQFYHGKGYTVIAGNSLCFERPSDFTVDILTCVSVVKRVIGLRSFWTLTPWQLYRRLNSMDDHWRLVKQDMSK